LKVIVCTIGDLPRCCCAPGTDCVGGCKPDACPCQKAKHFIGKMIGRCAAGLAKCCCPPGTDCVSGCQPDACPCERLKLFGIGRRAVEVSGFCGGMVLPCPPVGGPGMFHPDAVVHLGPCYPVPVPFEMAAPPMPLGIGLPPMPAAIETLPVPRPVGPAAMREPARQLKLCSLTQPGQSSLDGWTIIYEKGQARVTGPDLEAVCEHLSMCSETGELVLSGRMKLRCKQAGLNLELEGDHACVRIKDGQISLQTCTP
jgi:hypothetical protein